VIWTQVAMLLVGIIAGVALSMLLHDLLNMRNRK
jgi:hypothetical protein